MDILSHNRWLLVGLMLTCSITPGVMDTAGMPAWRPPTAKFNNLGLVSPFVELLNVQVTQDGTTKRSSTAEAAPATEWSQSDQDIVVIVWVPNLDESTVRVMLSITTLSVSSASKKGQRYRFEVDRLAGDILPGRAKWETETNRVVVTLPKRSRGVIWPSLSATNTDGSKKRTGTAQTRRRQVEVNTTHKYDVLEAEASDEAIGEGRVIARNDKVASTMTKLFSECSYVHLQTIFPPRRCNSNRSRS